MAENVTFQTTAAATPPDGTKVAVDRTSDGDVQIIKLAISADGSVTLIPADATNGIYVDVTRVGGTVAVTQSGTWDEVGINDSGNSITVDGTVAATQSGTWNVGTVTAVTGITNPVAVTDNSSTLSVDDGGGALTVDGTVAATQSGTWNVGTVTAVTGITNAVAVTDNSSTLSVDDGGGALTVDGTVAVSAVSGTVAVTDNDTTLSIDDGAGSITVDGATDAKFRIAYDKPDGESYETVVVSSDANYLPVEIKNASAISVSTGAVTLGEGSSTIGFVGITGDTAVQIQGYDPVGETYVTVAVDDSGNSRVIGNVADDAADSGYPVKVGGKAKAFDGTDPGSVSEDDRVHFVTDLNRRQYVNTVHPMFWTAVENNSSAQTNNAIKGAPGAGLSLYITDIVISTDAAINAKIVEDTGGTPATIAGPYYFAANGGAGLHFVTPIKATANKDIGYTTVGASNCTVQIHGFTAP